MVKCERTFPAPPSLAKRQSYNEEDTIQQLKKIFNDKCYICELQGLQDGIPEHLIPHKENVDLKFDWENLFWACNRCNSIKNRGEYEGKILDCCKFDPELYLNFIYAPYEGTIIVKPKDTAETSQKTAQLINEVFNLENTGLRISSCRERMRSFREEWNRFIKLLTEYKKNKTQISFRKIKARLSTKTAFAAFKRNYIRINQSEYKEFQEFVTLNPE